jgi:hypothetical protein
MFTACFDVPILRLLTERNTTHNTTEWLAKQTRGAFGMFASSSLLAEGLDRCRSGRSAGRGHR